MNEKIEKIRESKCDKMFTLVKDENEKVRIVIGNKVVSNKKFETFESADKYIVHKPWELIVNCVLVVMEFVKKQENNDSKEKNEVISEESKE